MEKLKEKKIVENSNTVLAIRKPYSRYNMQSRTVLTDDVFSYVDFYFKKNKKKLIGEDGKELKQNYMFYWRQAENFYKASQGLPIEAAPLTMYYSMLNAAKAYILFESKDVKKDLIHLSRHGLNEGHSDNDSLTSASLDSIYIKRKEKGVFTCLSCYLDDSFQLNWNLGKLYSIKELMSVLPFVHKAFVSTYSLKRKDEMFLPLPANTFPTFYYCSDKKIHLVFDLQKSYFKRNATSIPKEIEGLIPDEFDISKEDRFKLFSKQDFKKKEIINHYNKYRKIFSYISADTRMWYLNKKSDNSFSNINKISISMAIMHRFSEIVRYKPEQMEELLNGKENWLIKEYISLALDQFLDEIACEITKQEIMKSRKK